MMCVCVCVSFFFFTLNNIKKKKKSTKKTILNYEFWLNKLTKPKESQQHNKCYDIFTIPLFLVMVGFGMIFLLFYFSIRLHL